MTTGNNAKIQAQAQIEQFKNDVWIKRPITRLYHDARGYRAVFGKKKNGKRDFRRLGKDYSVALQIKELWNEHVAKNDTVNANAITTLNALRSAQAVEILNNTPYDLLDAVEFFIEHAMPTKGRITVDQAVSIFMEEQKMKGLKDASSSEQHSNYKTFYKPFREFYGELLLINLTPERVRAYFKARSKSWGPTAWNMHKGRLVTLWNLCAKLGYCSSGANPFEKLPNKKVSKDTKARKVLSLDVSQSFWKWIDAECESRPERFQEMAYYVLVDFCGARPDEAYRTTWEMIDPNAEDIGEYTNKDFTTMSITYWADQTKNRVAKINYVPWNAQKWFDIIKEYAHQTKKEELIHYDAKQRLKRLRKDFRKATGLKREQDDGRHTYGSNHLALYQDSGLTAHRMGHRGNPSLLWQWYATVMKPSNAKKYFEIIPQKIEQEEAFLAEYEQRQQAIADAQARSNVGKVRINKDTGEIEPIEDKRYYPYTKLHYVPKGEAYDPNWTDPDGLMTFEQYASR